MKKNKLYLAGFLIAMLLSACSDWLDVQPKDKLPETKQFSSEENINSALNGLYRQFVAENLYGLKLTGTILDMMGHCYTYTLDKPSETTGNMARNYALAKYDFTQDNVKKDFTDIWKDAYKTLLNVSVFIERLEETPTSVISQEHKNILLGEAYGLRAYLHLDLYRIFVPYNAEASNKVLPYLRSSQIVINHIGYKDNVYNTPSEYMDFLLGDIAKAQTLLANDPIKDPSSESITNVLKEDDFYKNRNRRMNFYAVKALEARALQYSGNESKAAEAAKVITDLVDGDKIFHWVDRSNYASTNNYKFFSEVIFGINNIDMDAQNEKNFTTSDIKVAYVVDQNNLMGNILGEYSQSLSGMLDIRAKQWIVSNINSNVGIGFSSAQTWMSSKYKYKATSAVSAANDLQVLFRISEMYYIQAEAALKSSKFRAIDILNKVLQHRGLISEDFLKYDATDAQIRSFITREYYREFMGEGQIYFYHKRIKSPQIFKGNGVGLEDIDPNKAYLFLFRRQKLIFKRIEYEKIFVIYRYSTLIGRVRA